MLLKETIVDVVDNSNIIKAKILSTYKNKISFVSSIVYFAKKKLKKNFFFPEKKKYGVITSTKWGVRRLSGIKISNSKNCLIVLQDKITPQASRFFGCFFLEVKLFFSAKPYISFKFFI